MSKCPKCIKALKTYNTEVKKEMTFNFTATQVMGTVEDPREDLVKKAVTCTIPSIDFKTADFAGGTGVYIVQCIFLRREVLLPCTYSGISYFFSHKSKLYLIFQSY